jgi:TonB-dependent starch-binding outer membrane protein SusC
MRKLKSSRLLSLLVALFFITQSAFSQSKVTGRVTDGAGKGIPGVTVSIKGTATATQTDENGKFSLVAPGNAILVLSSVGYTSTEVPIQGRSNIETTLGTHEASLNEVVVIGYGTARRRDLTGAVSTVTEKNFNKGTYTAPDQLIQGKVPGVQVLNNSGQPGGSTTVKIRGNSAITGTGQPLYVVDGVPLDGRSSRPGLNAQNLGNTPGGNPLNFINPADIASMEVLKDASATAIYGSRAAYGVILITTKKGQSGAPRIDFNASVGSSTIMKRIDVLSADQYRQALTYYGLGNANDKKSNVNALDAILQTGLVQNYNMAVSGGNENGKYRLSVGYLDQEGIVRKTGFKKYSADLNANFKFLQSKRLGIDFNIVPSQYNEDIAPISNDAGSTGSLIGQALQWNPTEALILKKSNGGDSLNIKAGDVVNPYAMSEAYSDKSRVTTILGSISPYYKFTDWLEYRFLFSMNYGSGVRRASIQQYINLADVKGKGWASIANNELLTQQATHTLNFNRSIAKNLNLNAVLGFEYLKFSNKGSNTTAYGPSGGFGNYGLDYTNYIQYSNSANRTISSFVDPTSELQSYFARGVFNFRERFLLTLTFRADGSSKFGENNKYGYFPSFGAAWNIDKEDFLKDNGLFTSLKLRGSWGKTGNQEFPGGAAQAKYSFTQNGGLGQVNNPNPDLKWQSDKQYNVGIDFGVLSNHITASVDYFNKTTTDLLFPSAPIQPAPPGSVVRWVNLDGQIENRGVEAAVNASIINSKDLTWDLGVNATFLKNTVSGLSAPIYTGGLHGQGVSGTLVQTIQNGLPVNAFYTRHYVGIDKATGQAIYPNGDVPTYEGDPNPSTLLGISTNLAYKNLSLNVNMNGAFGQVIYNNTLNNVINVGSINGGRNIAVSVYQDPVKESFSNPVTSSSRFIEKGDYLKLANATLSYGVGNVGKNLKNLNVFVTGQNLFVITKFSGFDPEVNVDKNNNGVPSVGIEYTPYPTARTITLGVNFSL